MFAEHEDGGWDRNRGFPRGRGQGRGRGFCGRGRGGFNPPHADTQQDGGYNDDAPPQGCGIFPQHFFSVLLMINMAIRLSSYFITKKNPSLMFY